MNVNGKVRLIARTKPGRERIYLTRVAKGHEIPVALGNTVATGDPIPRARPTPPNGLGSPARCIWDGSRGHREQCAGEPPPPAQIVYPRWLNKRLAK